MTMFYLNEGCVVVVVVVFLMGRVPERCNNSIPGINMPE